MDERQDATPFSEDEIPEPAELEDEEGQAAAEPEEAESEPESEPEEVATGPETDAGGGPESGAAGECGDESYDLDAVEVEVEQTLTRTRVISRLKAIVLELEGGSLEIEGIPVAELGDEVEFQIEYCEKDGKHELEIELEW